MHVLTTTGVSEDFHTPLGHTTIIKTTDLLFSSFLQCSQLV